MRSTIAQIIDKKFQASHNSHGINPFAFLDFLLLASSFEQAIVFSQQW